MNGKMQIRFETHIFFKTQQGISPLYIINFGNEVNHLRGFYIF
jgi:hypothetical protein